MVLQSCVNCHNSHPQTPKNNWEIGDVRGVISIVTPVHDEVILQSANTKTYQLLGGILIIGLLITLFTIGNNNVAKSELQSQKKKLEQALENLKESEEKYRVLSDNSLIGIFKTHISGKIAYVNNGFLQLLAYNSSNRQEFYTYNFSKLYHKNEDYEKILKNLKQFGKVENIEIEVVNKDNELQTFLFTATLVEEHIYGGVMDITKLKKVEYKLKLANQLVYKSLAELKETQAHLLQSEKMDSIGQLTSGVAHELNNPINYVIAGSLGLKMDVEELIQLLEKYENFDFLKVKEEVLQDIEQFKTEIDCEFLKNNVLNSIKDIQMGTRRMAEIVKGLRSFSRLDTEVKVPTNIHEGLDNTLIILNTILKNKIEVVCQYDKNICNVDGFSGQLNQVFMNIIANAEQAIEDKGTIYITTKHKGVGILISIKDTGVGMSASLLTRIFDPFFTTKEIGYGIGLGLSISYGIIQAHKGSITVESEEKKGTTFHIYLPYEFN